MEPGNWITIFLTLAGFLWILITAIVGAIWTKINRQDKEIVLIGKEIVTIKTKLANGFEATRKEIKKILEAHGEKLHRLELASAVREGREVKRERGLQEEG